MTCLCLNTVKLVSGVDSLDSENDFTMKQCPQMEIRYICPFQYQRMGFLLPASHQDQASGRNFSNKLVDQMQPTLSPLSTQRQAQGKRRSAKMKERAKWHLKWNSWLCNTFKYILLWDCRRKLNHGLWSWRKLAFAGCVWPWGLHLIFASFTLLISPSRVTNST